MSWRAWRCFFLHFYPHWHYAEYARGGLTYPEVWYEGFWCDICETHRWEGRMSAPWLSS